MAEKSSPIDQFKIETLVPIKIGDLDISFTNSSLWMVIAVVVASLVFIVATRKRSLVPGRLQSFAEMLYDVVANMVRDNVGNEGRPYFPLIFTLYLFLLFGNLLGLLPTAFTFTSHIVVTFMLATVIFLGVTIIGIWRHKLGYARLFFPHGAPIATAPILIPIELVSYLSRPISLSVRLFANMTVGHVILKVIAGFGVAAVAAGGVTAVFSIFPIGILVALTTLEFLIAILQAYIFTILSCIYLHDAIHLH